MLTRYFLIFGLLIGASQSHALTLEDLQNFDCTESNEQTLKAIVLSEKDILEKAITICEAQAFLAKKHNLKYGLGELFARSNKTVILTNSLNLNLKIGN